MRRLWFDEVGLRWLLLLSAALSVFAPLLLPDMGGPPLTHVQRLGCLVLVIGPALFVGVVEPRGEGVGATLVQRASRLAPSALAMALGGALLFPTAWTWRYGWSLFALHVPLPLLWHLPRVRATSLGLLSLMGFTSAALTPQGAWCLLAVAALWVGLPALDRAEALRARRGPGTRPAWGPVLAGPLGALLVGALLFAGAVALLPPGQPLPEWTPGAPSAARRAVAQVGSRLPILELALLVVGAGALLVLFQMTAGSRRSERELRAPTGMDVGAPAPLDPEALARAVASWPAGPRRDMVELYLAHLQRLESQGHPRAPGTPPLAWAHELGDACPAAGPPADRLASAFSAARWGPSPVAPEAVREARAAADAAEQALTGEARSLAGGPAARDDRTS